jgi:gliding motility-associated-like protein
LGRKSLVIATLLMLGSLRMAAQVGPFEFIENKGQWDGRVKYMSEVPAGEFYIHTNGFTVAQHNPDELMRLFKSYHNHGQDDPKHPKTKTGKLDPNLPGNGGQPGGLPVYTVHSHAYRVSFAGASNNARMAPERPLPTYNNYFIGNDPSKWASNVNMYQAITIKNVYPNIDVRYYAENDFLKYDFIVHPGGDVNNILMKYEGADKLSIRKNQLIIKTSVGENKELYPYTYEFNNTTGKKEVSCSFELADKNTVRFKVGDYSKTSTLVIDPTRIFCSFTRSPANQWGFTATPGPDGSLYSGGIVFGPGFPTSPGAYQSSYQGGSNTGQLGGIDMGIFKFTPNGAQRSYATYIGGRQGNDFPHSLVCDAQGNLVVMGRTSSSDYPGTVIGGGSDDIAVTKLNANGSNVIGSLRIGGSASDGVNIRDQLRGGSGPTSLVRFYGDDSRSEVILDGSANIYVAAQTQSNNFPVQGTVFQTGSGGAQDGVVMKINPTCTGIIWASYLGGSSDDGAFVISLNPLNNDIYVGGGTSSGNVPGNKSGSYQGSFQGGASDGYIAQISNDGSTLIRSSYMGTSAFDAVYGVKFDRLGFPYIMGISEGGWPVQNAAYSNPNSKQFVAKVRPDLSGFAYSTVFGSGAARPNISPVAFLVDRCENVYISGWGGWLEPGNDPYLMTGTIGMPTTPDALKTATDNRDMYFIVLKRNAASLLYGSFFGQDGGEGEHVDGGTSRFDEQGVIYQAICANCFGGSNWPITRPFPVSPGVWGPNNPTGANGCNLAAVKIAFNFAGVGSGPKSYFNNVPDTSGCVPFTLQFRDTILNAKSYRWDFGDGSAEVVTTTFNISHTYNAVGNYRVRLIAIDSTTCNIADTAYLNIRVRDDKADIALRATKQMPCQSLSYMFDNLSTGPASKPVSTAKFIWDFGDGTRIPVTGTASIGHAYASAGTYNVRLILTDTNYCNAPDSVPLSLRVSPLVDARFETPASGCAPYTAVFNNTSLAGQTYRWDFGDGTGSTEEYPTHLYPNIGTYTVKLVVIDSSTCNIIDSVEHTIVVSPLPTADFSAAPQPPVQNKPVIFTNLSTGGVKYEWQFGDGEIRHKNTMDTAMHVYNATGTYDVCLITTNQYGCTDTICKPVQADILPLLDVPNAFTPGRFGKNSIVRVEGFGIGKMTWRIYNRWGQKVFESVNRYQGWDGNFNGKPQPMDVYAYTLDVEFTDGKTLRKTGDITLIR